MLLFGSLVALLLGARSTPTLDLTMPWQPRFRHLWHPRRGPQRKEPPYLFQVSQWSRMPQSFLTLVILKLGAEERVTSGPTRTRFRAKRLRAVKLFRRRLARVPKLAEFSMSQLPKLGQ